jgi:ubiquinone/menaquinone biosynthesis C-methylase UbiE
MKTRYEFYKKVLGKWILNKNASVLVCGGGAADRNIFFDAGFQNVTITNIDERMNASHFDPYVWRYADIESLPFKDGEFDFVVAHAVLHHAASPHRALLEMYRVAGVAVIVVESRDSLLMRLLIASGIVHPYEIQAVHLNGGSCGGWQNRCIPNYVYRWTEREVEKTICSFAPYARHEISYLYGTNIQGVLEHEKSGIHKMLILRILKPFHIVFSTVFKKQQNLFAFRVEKPILTEMLFPWLVMEKGAVLFNREFASQRYRK